MHHLKQFFLFLLLYSWPCSYAAAQQWGFEQLGTDRGLPASETYNMIQDEKGYVYVATEYGMVKYNGNRFVPVCSNIPARERVAYAFCKNSKGEHYFVNSQFHIYVLKNDSAFRLRIAGSIVPALPHSSPVNQLVTDSTGNIYAFSPYESFRYEATKRNWVPLKEEQQQTNAIVVEKIGNDYISSSLNKKRNRIIVRNTEYDGEYKLAYTDISPYRYKVIENSHGIYLFRKGQVLRITKQKKMLVYRTPEDILSHNVSADGHYWIGTHYMGLLELDTNLHLRHHYLEHLSIANILFDRQGGVWATTLEQGVFHCKNVHQYHYDNLEGFSGEIRFLKTINNRLFVGTVNGKLLVIGADGKRVIAFGRRNIQDMIPWQQGYLVSVTNCIFFLSPSFLSSVVLPKNTSYQLLPLQKKFLRVSPTRLSFFSERFVLQQTLVTPAKIKCLLSLDTGAILAGSTKGLFVIRNDSLSIPPVLSPLRNCHISDLKQSREGNLWICTKGDGLFLLTPDQRLTKVTTPSGIITNISFFKDSIILLSTNIGLYSKSYTAATREWNDLYDGEVLSAVPYRDKIFIGTKHGLIALDTTGLFHAPPFPVYLSSVSAMGRTLSTTDIMVQYQEHDLTFTFDVLSYNRQAAPLAYRLNGPLSSEGQVSGTQLFLQNLRPGHYTLNIYRDTGTKWPALVVPFYIQPAFWQTGTFLIFMIVTGLCLLLGGAYLLFRRTRSAAFKKAAIQRTLSEYKLTALKAQINPHFISNSLAAIQQLVLFNEVDKASRYLALFSLFIRQVLQYSDKALVPLSDELKIIELNVSLEQLRFSDQFLFELDLAPGIDPKAMYIPPLITQPFIENAIWHGLLPLDGGRRPKLLIKVRREQDNIILSVIDNGIGRKANPGQDPPRNGAFPSRGIALTQSRIENLNQLYTGAKASMQITDLYECATAAGTQIDIILPYLSDIAYENQHQESYY